jgi:hypothetical protein
MVALAEFLSERLPQLRDEWEAHRDELLATGQLPRPGGSQTRPHIETNRKVLPHG